MPERILIVDVSYLVYRSFFAYPKLTYQNSPIGAFFGFSKTVLALIKQFQPQQLVFANDLPTPTWRHKLLDSYKAGRPKPEEDMLVQFPIIQNWTEQITTNCFATGGFEADDIIATITQKQTNTDREFLIFSSDRDLYQLFVNPQVYIIQTDKMGKISLLGHGEFSAKFELQPSQWLDYKALVGDSSDNLKGVEGIGPKTATLILQQIGSLAWLFEALGVQEIAVPNQEEKELSQNYLSKLRAFLENSKNEKLIQKLLQNREQIEQIRHLATLQIVPDITLDPTGYDLNRGIGEFEKYNFKSLVKAVSPTALQERQNQESEALF